MTRTLPVIAALFASACTGTIGDSHPDSGSGSGGELVPPDCTTRGPRMIRRLSNLMIRNTLRRAFRDDNVPSADVVADPVVNGFKVDATQAVVRDLDAQLIMSYAETVGDWVATNKLGQLSSCQSLDVGCVRPFVETMGLRLFREPLAAESIDLYEGLVRAESTFADGARALVSSMIQSPRFLYRRELGVERADGLFELTPYELASSLSYMLTSSPPDDELLAAAASGALSNRDELDRQLARLLATPESAATFGQFARDWLQIDDLLRRAKLDPTNQLTDAIRSAMLDETSQLFVGVLRTGRIADLFTGPVTVGNAQLASYYGPGPRAPGLLGNGSVLTRHALAETSSPVQRGKLVRERLLCEVLAPPPPNVDANLPAPMGAITTRQRYEAHSSSTACKSCHVKLDPVGFTFERYDAFGRRRDLDNGLSIDTTGSLDGMPEGSVALDGIDSLASYLGASTQVRDCLTRYLAYYSFGLDRCGESELRAEVAAGDGSLASILGAIIHSSHFTTRTRE